MHPFEECLTARGVAFSILWEEKGPKDTNIQKHAMYVVGGGVVYVQTYKPHKHGEFAGWQAFTPNPENSVNATIDDVLRRCSGEIAAIILRER